MDEPQVQNFVRRLLVSWINQLSADAGYRSVLPPAPLRNAFRKSSTNTFRGGRYPVPAACWRVARPSDQIGRDQCNKIVRRDTLYLIAGSVQR
jgi:hypothetical protein